MHIEYAPKLNVSSIVKSLKGRSSRRLQQEFPKLKMRYWGDHFWAAGYGVWSSGNITDKMVNEYLEHHRRKEDNDNSAFYLSKKKKDFQSCVKKNPCTSSAGWFSCHNDTCKKL